MKLDVSLEAFLMADRYVAQDGKEWVNMVVSIEKVLDVLEGKTEAAGINQLENRDTKTGANGADGHANQA